MLFLYSSFQSNSGGHQFNNTSYYCLFYECAKFIYFISSNSFPFILIKWKSFHLCSMSSRWSEQISSKIWDIVFLILFISYQNKLAENPGHESQWDYSLVEYNWSCFKESSLVHYLELISCFCFLLLELSSSVSAKWAHGYMYFCLVVMTIWKG